jgi:c-di-GMP-binding flagellar brake protein YcgR
VKYIDDRPIDDILMIKGNGFPVLPKNTPVAVVIATNAGDRIKYDCRVDFSSNFQMNITLNSDKGKELEDKRRYYKIKTEINCRISDLTRGDEVTAYSPNLYGKIQDINIGGIFFTAEGDVEYSAGDVIGFTTVLGDNRLETAVKVLRVQRAPEGGIKGYGCSFVHIASYQEEMISSYINYLQIEERRLDRERRLLEREEAERVGGV